MIPRFSPSPTSYLIILLSSRFHIILGSGDPSASQVILTELPSSTIISGEVFESIIVGGTLISRHIVKTYKKVQYILKGKRNTEMSNKNCIDLNIPTTFK